MTHEPTNSETRATCQPDQNRPFSLKKNSKKMRKQTRRAASRLQTTPHTMRCPAEDALPPNLPRVVTMAKLTYFLLNIPAACPPRTASPCLPTYFLSKIGDNGPAASQGTVRRASHQQFSEEPGRNATDYAMFPHPTMKLL